MHFREEDGFKKQRKKNVCVRVCVCVCERESERESERERERDREEKDKKWRHKQKTDKSGFFALKSILNDGTYFVNLIKCIGTRFFNLVSIATRFFLGFWVHYICKLLASHLIYVKLGTTCKKWMVQRIPWLYTPTATATPPRYKIISEQACWVLPKNYHKLWHNRC